MSTEIIAVLTALGTLITTLGGKEYLDRKSRRKETRDDEERAEKKDVSVVEAKANVDTLHILLGQIDKRVEGYEVQIRAMETKHSTDIAELKAENRDLERRVSDLQTTLSDYQLGRRVPPGQVLVPATHVQLVRERAAGLLPLNYYPGEETPPYNYGPPPGPPPGPQGPLVQAQGHLQLSPLPHSGSQG